ncbi:MAG TPA: SbcC/MukB-like Walker B domain-containing protein [Trebonia sp.]|nr:SbcC/MukB-like Walker B domain-containing protein [Trebonia sp.]
MSERFKPTRAGVINVWDYVDEEWAFADGRLALRGHNGSGKTKALEVLFPFVLDGVADSRRLDPFSGENRTMKSNLLYRGQDSEYGYVWMEFARAGMPDTGMPDTGMPHPGTHGTGMPGSGPPDAGGPDIARLDTVTLVIGMRALRNSDGVRMSFFVTGRRLGVDFGLLSADSRPLTERQLRAVLEPDAWRRTATEYRDLVDHRLFGLGRERYAQLLDLLLALRRPLLAKDLDPAKVSDTLTAGLSPVDEDLVQQAARDFENLAAVQRLFDDLMAANAAVGEFRTHYEAYLRAHVRFALDRVQARSDTAADHAERLAAAAVARRRAAVAERAAEADREASRTEGERIGGRLEGLKNSEEYKAQGRIEDKRREVAARAADVARQRAGLDSGRRRIAGLTEEVAKLSRRAADSRAAAARHAAALADAAQRSGIADDGFGPIDPGDQGSTGDPGSAHDSGITADPGDALLIAARARVAARRDDIGAIRGLLEAIRDARAKRAYADQELARKQATEQRQQSEADAAAARLAQARAAADDALSAWTARWAAAEDVTAPAAPSFAPAAAPAAAAGLPGQVVTATDAATLAAALDRAGEPGAASLSEIYDGCVSDRRAAAITVRTQLDAALTEASRRLAGLRAERDAIAAERDDAPASTDLRPASREGRPGAPLWQLVRFAPGVPDDTAAAIEGALYGAGLLTAWVHPDPALTAAALAAAEADGYLIPVVPVHNAQVTAAKTAKTLADVLVAEDQEHVPSDVIAAVLHSITLADEIMAPGSDIPEQPLPADPARGAPRGTRGVDFVFGDVPGPGRLRSPGVPAGNTGPAVSARAQFSYGVHVGARPKTAPEYIGATNRAARRRARLEAHGRLIAQAETQAAATAADRAAAAELLDDFRRARGELPDTGRIAKEAAGAASGAALLAHARAEAGSARQLVDEAIAEADARTRQLRHQAAERRLPGTSEEVDAIARAAAEFENAATALHAERRTLARAEGDARERAETLERQRAEHGEAEAAAGEAGRLQAALEEEFRSLEEALQQDVQQVLEQIRQSERELRDAQNRYSEHDRKARREHDQLTAADRDVANERQALADAVAHLHEQARQFGEFTRPDLRPLVGVSAAGPWPETAAWPPPPAASDELTAGLLGSDTPLDPVAAVSGTLPPSARELLGAFAAATRGGRQVTEGTVRNSQDRLSAALKDFTDALALCEEDYRVDFDPGTPVIVHVVDDEGRKPVAAFALRIDERAKDQGILLEDRERKVLEDELLAALAGQIHARVVAARDLTRNMNADTRSKPMSSGISIGIRWAQSDKVTDAQRQASRLVDRDQPGPGRLAELRGVLRDMIREYRAAHPRATYREALAAVLDYRSWHSFELLLVTPGEGEARLTRARHSVMSGGEKSAAIHLPLFAAANALYGSAKDHCPRLIALDEAFVGIDERYKPDLFGLAVKFDLDLFMTGHDLWVTTATVPMIAHYDLYHDKVTRTTSALLILWDGEQLLDASAGFSDNEALVTELLGIRPTRHTPLGQDATLYVPALGPEPADPDDED